MDDASSSKADNGGLRIRGRAAPAPPSVEREKRIPTSPRAGRDVRQAGDKYSSANASNPPLNPSVDSRSHQARPIDRDGDADPRNRSEQRGEATSSSREIVDSTRRSYDHPDDARNRGDEQREAYSSSRKESEGDQKRGSDYRGDKPRSRRDDELRNRSDQRSSSRKDVDYSDRRNENRETDRDRDRSRRRREDSEDSDDRRRDRRRRSEHVRDRSRSHDRDRARNRDTERAREKERDRRRNDRKRSYSDSESDISDSEDDNDDIDHRRRREKRRKEEKEERRRRKEKKREKKSSKDKGKKTASSTASWGKYGVIGEGDMFLKGSEFRAWLVEERQLNPDTLPRDKTKKEFALFVEDYNTATLSHEKYYDLSRYQARMNLIKSGATLPIDGGSYNFAADMKAHQATIDSKYEKPTATLSREEIMELRKIESERIEIGQRRLLGLDIPKYFGVRTEEVDRATLFNDEPLPYGFQS